MIRRVALAALALAAPAAAAPPGSPLFASDAPLRLTINGPLKAIADGKRGDERRPGTLTAEGFRPSPVTLAARGITRRSKETCAFPPLRVDFNGAPDAASPFAGQRRLKLVTHCQDDPKFQQKLLLEYAAYRLYNLLTPLSFRARLATIDYVGERGDPIATRYGFFIEDIDEVAARNGLAKASVGQAVPSSRLAAVDAGRFAVFEYMIANYDWAMTRGAPSEGCCHNSRLLQSPAGFIPVPYDFDYSGLVGAPYAVPPDQVPITSVRQRRYRGFCHHNGAALQAAAALRGRRGEVAALFASLPGMTDGTRRTATTYLDRFFDDIADDRRVASRLLKACL